MRRVLVTGVTGFIGRHVVEPLRALGFEVHGASQTATSGDGLATAHAVDLLVSGALSRLVAAVHPTHLMHLAWLNDPGRGMASPANQSWADATLELYRAFAEGGGQRAVFAGSCAEYDWSHSLLHETQTPLRPATLYGEAKNAVRIGIEGAARQPSVSLAWARIFFLYGPHEPKGRLVSEVASSLAAGRLVETTHGLQERDFMHVADAAAALVALLDSGVTGPVNVASGECVPVRRIVETLGRISGRPDLIAIGARAAAPGEAPRLAADIARLKDEVGFSPRYRLDDGLAATLAWWRDPARAVGEI